MGAIAYQIMSLLSSSDCIALVAFSNLPCQNLWQTQLTICPVSVYLLKKSPRPHASSSQPKCNSFCSFVGIWQRYQQCSLSRCRIITWFIWKIDSGLLLMSGLQSLISLTGVTKATRVFTINRNLDISIWICQTEGIQTGVWYLGSGCVAVFGRFSFQRRVRGYRKIDFAFISVKQSPEHPKPSHVAMHIVYPLTLNIKKNNPTILRFLSYRINKIKSKLLIRPITSIKWKAILVALYLPQLCSTNL